MSEKKLPEPKEIHMYGAFTLEDILKIVVLIIAIYSLFFLLCFLFVY